MTRLEIAASLAARVRDLLAAAFPEEGCGLLAGAETADGTLRVVAVHPSPNVSADDRRSAYRVDPGVHLAVQRRLRGSGFDIVGAFHSHPTGPPHPSRRDLAEALPGFVYLIGSPGEDGVLALRAFRLVTGGDEFEELPIAEKALDRTVASADSVLDLRGEVCPYTFIRAKLLLEEMALGATLAVILDHPPAFESVPRSLAAEGHEIVSVERAGAEATVVVRKDAERAPAR